MRRLLILLVILAFGGMQQAHARLFWQTYGSVTAHPGGCGCAWNSNQDFFVPRNCEAGRYGLFSPCKTSCTDSPACKYQHPLYPGYCTVYGPCHYCWRNHVYRCYCGCCGIHPYRCNGVCAHWCGPLRYGCGGCCGHCRHHGSRRRRCGGCYCGAAGSCPGVYPGGVPYFRPAPNVESSGVEVLGTVPVQGDELLASIDLDLDQPAPIETNQQSSEDQLPIFGKPQ